MENGSKLQTNKRNSRRKPSWLKRKIPAGAAYRELNTLLDKSGITTVCREARCPNLGECYSRGTATFMILGAICTRACRFCAVTNGEPLPPDAEEPHTIARACSQMKLSYAVVTSVTRDDLSDGGSAQFAATISAIRDAVPRIGIEVLIPDFQGDSTALDTVLSASPDVLNHNIETVPRLYTKVRPGADYSRSLGVFSYAAQKYKGALKSGLMLGLGEQSDEVLNVLTDLLNAGVSRLTLGQYLMPSQSQLPVAEYITPDAFDKWRDTALSLGFSAVASGPFVRSSYHAESLVNIPESKICF